MAGVSLRHLSKRYSDGANAVNQLSIDVSDGEFLVLVGPSGCGKSTALKMIAGLESITEGEVLIGEEVVNDFSPRDRDIAMVFQSYALYPHMTVFDNIAFSLQLAGESKASIKSRVDDVANILQLEEHLHRRPAGLSGGQRQRVAMGRAIIRQPAVFLMDEPLSNLDAKLRVLMRSEIARLQKRLGVTTIYVTHDQVEAMTMGDRVALMRDGVLQQISTPSRIYEKPVNTFVASFIGSPSMNLFYAHVQTVNESGIQLALGEQTLQISRPSIAEHTQLLSYAKRPVIVGIRPEHIEDATLITSLQNRQIIIANVLLVESLGSDLMAHLDINASAALIDTEIPEDIAITDDAVNCIARFNSRSTVEVGQEIEIAIESDRLHFFDADSGQTLRDGCE